MGANNVYDVIVKATSGTTSDTQAIAVSVNNINEAPTIVSSNTASFAESAANGTFIGGVFSATDTEGSAVKFVLTNDADGRFQIVKDAAGYHLAVAQNLLIDHQVGDASHGYSVQVQAVDADGLDTSDDQPDRHWCSREPDHRHGGQQQSQRHRRH